MNLTDILNQVIDYLKKYSNIILVIITGIYAYLTRKVLINTRNEHESMMRPYIIINSFLRDEAIVSLLIKNVGKTAAWDVRFDLDKNIYQHKKPERNIKEFELFRNGTSCMPPGEEYRIDLSIYQDFYEIDKNAFSPPNRIKIKSEYSYESIAHRKKRRTVIEDTIIDFQSSLNTSIPRNEIVKAIQEVSKKIEELKK